MTARADRLAAIEAREKAATPGEWEHEVSQGMAGLDSGWEVFRQEAGEWQTIVHTVCAGDNCKCFEDAVFIANARTDVGYLIGEVRRLAAALENIERYNNEMGENGSLYVKVQARAALKDSP